MAGQSLAGTPQNDAKMMPKRCPNAPGHFVFFSTCFGIFRTTRELVILVARPWEIPVQDHHQNHLKPYFNTIFEGRDRQKWIQGGRAVHFALVKNSKSQFWTPIRCSCVATKITIYRALRNTQNMVK